MRKYEELQTYGNQDDRYYRFQIREWIPMDRPILPKEFGYDYRFTNMFLLENMEYVTELLIHSEEEYRFYSELKRRTGKVLEDNKSASGFELGDIKVLFDNGQIEVFRNGREVGNCSVSEFSKQPNATFRRLQRYAELQKSNNTG